MSILSSGISAEVSDGGGCHSGVSPHQSSLGDGSESILSALLPVYLLYSLSCCPFHLFLHLDTPIQYASLNTFEFACENKNFKEAFLSPRFGLFHGYLTCPSLFQVSQVTAKVSKNGLMTWRRPGPFPKRHYSKDVLSTSNCLRIGLGSPATG
jgi:hypothetical protein